VVDAVEALLCEAAPGACSEDGGGAPAPFVSADSVTFEVVTDEASERRPAARASGAAATSATGGGAG
jgi:hypothetical protein